MAFQVWTVVGQWAPRSRGQPGMSTEFEVGASTLWEAKDEGQKTLDEDYPSGGRVTAVKPGPNNGLWHQLAAGYAESLRRMQAPPPEWWEEFLSEEEKTHTSTNTGIAR